MSMVQRQKGGRSAMHHQKWRKGIVRAAEPSNRSLRHGQQWADKHLQLLQCMSRTGRVSFFTHRPRSVQIQFLHPALALSLKMTIPRFHSPVKSLKFGALSEATSGLGAERLGAAAWRFDKLWRNWRMVTRAKRAGDRLGGPAAGNRSVKFSPWQIVPSESVT